MFVKYLLFLFLGIISRVSCLNYSNPSYFPLICKPSDSFIRDPLDCNVYYQCIYGFPIKMGCAKGLCFNLMTSLCDWCDLVPECTATITTTEKPVQTTHKPEDPYMPCPVMNMSIFLGHPKDCTKFYYCKRNQLVAQIGYCAVGLWFNFWKQRCEIPWEYVCKKSSS